MEISWLFNRASIEYQNLNTSSGRECFDGICNTYYLLSQIFKLMQLFKEYGDNLFAEVGRSNSPVLANLIYYQALLLLGIPEDEREKFILQHDVKNMTTGELDRALKEQKQTPPEKEQALVTPCPIIRGKSK